jgi:hypothetical protein
MERDERGAGIDDDEIGRLGVVRGGSVGSGGGTSDGGGAGTIG